LRRVASRNALALVPGLPSVQRFRDGGRDGVGIVHGCRSGLDVDPAVGTQVHAQRLAPDEPRNPWRFDAKAARSTRPSQSHAARLCFTGWPSLAAGRNGRGNRRRAIVGMDEAKIAQVNDCQKRHVA
jgi:hypothetical protein